MWLIHRITMLKLLKFGTRLVIESKDSPKIKRI
jgi:hypothetical protein